MRSFEFGGEPVTVVFPNIGQDLTGYPGVIYSASGNVRMLGATERLVIDSVSVDGPKWSNNNSDGGGFALEVGSGLNLPSFYGFNFGNFVGGQFQSLVQPTVEYWSVGVALPIGVYPYIIAFGYPGSGPLGDTGHPIAVARIIVG